MASFFERKSTRLAHYVVAIIGIGFLLIYAKFVLAPIALAFLFSMMLYPAVSKLEQYKWPRSVSILAMLVSFLIAVGSVITALSLVVRRFLQNVPNMEAQFQDNIAAFDSFVSNALNAGNPSTVPFSQRFPLSEIINADLLSKVAGSTASVIVTGVLTIVFSFFMLYYRDRFKDFVHRLFAKKRHASLHVMFDQIDDVAPRYLLGIITVVSILAVINSAGFALIGVQSPIMMGVIAAILNLIPFVGTIFGFGIVFLFTLATQSINIAFGVLIMFFVVQLLDNNVLTPNITASKIKLNPFFAVLAILVGNLIWGVLGMFVALPFLAMIKIICDNTKKWQPLGELLGIERHTQKEDATEN